MSPSQFFESVIQRVVVMSPYEIGGSIFGIAGAFLLAKNNSHSRWGWVSFLVSNGFLIAFALAIEAYAMLVMQLVFSWTSVTGIKNWFFPKNVAVNEAK